MNQTDNRYKLLYGLSLFEPDDRTPLCSVEEVADFLLTHDGGIITEPDGAVLLEAEDREFVSCTDSEMSSWQNFEKAKALKTGSDTAFPPEQTRNEKEGNKCRILTD